MADTCPLTTAQRHEMQTVIGAYNQAKERFEEAQGHLVMAARLVLASNGVDPDRYAGNVSTTDDGTMVIHLRPEKAAGEPPDGEPIPLNRAERRRAERTAKKMPAGPAESDG